jgi:RimJ/RimL family protein N-acetyltransferase
MMDWTLSQPGMQTVTAGCAPDNIASQRVLEKIGMRSDRSARESLGLGN